MDRVAAREPRREDVRPNGLKMFRESGDMTRRVQEQITDWSRSTTPELRGRAATQGYIPPSPASDRDREG